jgi:hypothetical protein
MTRFKSAANAEQLQEEPGCLYAMTPNPSIEGTLSGQRPPSAPHVKR